MRFFSIMRKHDFNKPSKLIALDLIWASIGYRIRPEKITLGPAQELDQRPDIDDDENTFVPAEVDPTEDTRFQGGNGFLYRRIHLSELQDIDTLEIVPPKDVFSTEDILDQINDHLSTQMTMSDLMDIEYHKGQTKFTLYANPTSWCWIGSSDYGLQEVIKPPLFAKYELDGFHEYVPGA